MRLSKDEPKLMKKLALSAFGVLLCLLALIAAPLCIAPLADWTFGPVKIISLGGMGEITTDEISRAIKVQVAAVSLAFLCAALAISLWVKARGHLVALWLANPLAILLGVLLFDRTWGMLEARLAETLQIPYESLLQTRAFAPESSNQLYWLCFAAILASFLASWAGASLTKAIGPRIPVG